MGSDREAQVVDSPAARRFVLRLGDEVVGSLDYRLANGRIVLWHTEVDPPRRQAGLGSRLAEGALDAARERGLTVVAECPFIAAFIERNPQYTDLLDRDRTG